MVAVHLVLNQKLLLVEAVKHGFEPDLAVLLICPFFLGSLGASVVCNPGLVCAKFMCRISNSFTVLQLLVELKTNETSWLCR